MTGLFATSPLRLLCRAHFAFVYLNVFWTSWLIVEYYKVCVLLELLAWASD